MKYIIIIALLISIAAPVYSANDSLKVYLTKGGKGLSDKDFAKAKINYENVLRLDPNNFEATKNLGVVSSATGRPKLALEYFQAALKLNSADPDIFNNLGVLSNDEKNYPQAVEYFQKALMLNPDKPILLNNLAQGLINLGRHSEAMIHLKKADSLQPNTYTWYTMANSYAATKDYRQAEIYYEKCIRDSVFTAEIFYFTGVVKQKLNKTDEAISFFKSTIKIDSTHTQARQALGISYFLDKQYTQSINNFSYLVNQNPDNHNFKISLGVAYALKGERAKTEAIVGDLMAIDSTLGFRMLGIIKSEFEKLSKSSR